MDNIKIVQEFLCKDRPCFKNGKCAYVNLPCTEYKLMMHCLVEKDATFLKFLIAYTGTIEKGEEVFKEYKLYEHI